MTTTILLIIAAYSVLLGLIAKREVPQPFRLPLWVMSASAAVGMTLAALPIAQVLGSGWIAYPFVVVCGAISLLAVVLVVHPLRRRGRADSLTA